MIDDRDPVAVLGLVHVVRRHVDGRPFSTAKVAEVLPALDHARLLS
jgi:hypothetical protein